MTVAACFWPAAAEGANSAGKMSFRRAKIGLDAAEQMSYSRRLKDSTTNPRGWVCIGDFRDDGIPADREAQGRGHGCKRRASDTLTIAAQAARGHARAARVAERPIAPGNGSCPLPPWDTAFPGAFFLRSRVHCKWERLGKRCSAGNFAALRRQPPVVDCLAHHKG
jgi:hypothetical protein